MLALDALKRPEEVSADSVVGEYRMLAQRLRRPFRAGEARQRESGYTLVEAMIVVAIGLILTTFAVVMVQSAIRSYTVSSTANSVARLIGVIRYTGITQGSNACTLFVNNQFGTDPDCNGSFTNTDQRVQIPNGVTVSTSTSLSLSSLPYSPAPTTLSCSNYAITFNTRGNKTSVCGTTTGGAVTNIFFVSDAFGNNSAVTITGTGRARSWQYINGGWQ